MGDPPRAAIQGLYQLHHPTVAGYRSGSSPQRSLLLLTAKGCFFAPGAVTTFASQSSKCWGKEAFTGVAATLLAHYSGCHHSSLLLWVPALPIDPLSFAYAIPALLDLDLLQQQALLAIVRMRLLPELTVGTCAHHHFPFELVNHKSIQGATPV